MTNPPSPDRSARAALTVLILSPFISGLIYLLATAQGADPVYGAVIAIAMFAFCLVAAAHVYIRGNKSRSDIHWLGAFMRLLIGR